MARAKIHYHQVRDIHNLRDLLHQSVDLFGDKTAFLWNAGGGMKKVSYKQFQADVECLGTALIDAGLKGKYIAVMGENRYEWAVSYLAVVNGTGVVVPIDKELPALEIESLLNRAKVSAIICSDKYMDKILKVQDKIPTLEMVINMDSVQEECYEKYRDKGYKLLKEGNLNFTNAVINEKALNILLFTSGTTGFSKAVMLSQRNICKNIMDMCRMIYIDPSDVFLSVLPIHHTYECTCGFLCALYCGASIGYCEGLKHIAKNLSDYKVTVMLGVPAIFEMMYRKIWHTAEKTGQAKKLQSVIKLSNTMKKVHIDLSKLLFKSIYKPFGGKAAMFISGAAGIDPQVAQGFRELGFRFLQGYGLTECSPIIALNTDKIFNDAAAGFPLANVDIKIADQDEEGIGEIIARGGNIMLGYYEDPDLTETVLKDGWFYTGDLGYIDEDGFVFVTGRKKNVIVKKNGKNVFPEEIEYYLMKNPYIKECMAYGKENKSDGEVDVIVKIIPDEDAFAEKYGPNYSQDDVNKELRFAIKETNAQITAYKRISDFEIKQGEFAKTTTQKIKRYLETD